MRFCSVLEALTQTDPVALKTTVCSLEAYSPKCLEKEVFSEVDMQDPA